MMVRGQALSFFVAVAALLLGADRAAAGLLSAWEFNPADVAGSNVAASGGSAANTTGALQDNAAIASDALDLDGANDYLQFGNNVTDLRTQSQMTLAAWVNPDTASAALRRIFEHEDNIYFWSESNAYRFTIHGSATQAVSTTAPAVGSWQHVLVTYASGAPAQIYINGVLEGTSAGNQVAIPNNTHTLQIGARRSGSGAASNFWDGQLDDVAVWNSVLSSSNIEALAGVGAGGYTGRTVPTAIVEGPPPPSGGVLTNHWTMDNDDVSGATVEDVVGGLDGTKTNGGPTTGLPGVAGQAADFAGGANNGNNEFIDLGAHAATLGGLSQGTITAFIKPDTTGLDTNVLTIFSASDVNAGSVEARWFVSNDNPGSGFDAGNLVYGTRGSSNNGTVVTSGVDLLDGEWHHVAVSVSSGGAVQLYIDGELRGAGSASFFGGLSAVTGAAIGRNKDSTTGGGQWFFEGLIDDVRIYDRPLTEAEIGQLAAIPEPSSVALLLLGVGGWFAGRRRRGRIIA